MRNIRQQIVTRLLLLDNRTKSHLQTAFDASLLCFCFSLSMLLRLDTLSFFNDTYFLSAIGGLFVFSIFNVQFFNLDREVIRYFSFESLRRVILAVVSSTVFLVVMAVMIDVIPRSTPGIFLLVASVIVPWSRYVLRVFLASDQSRPTRRLAIFGAGSTGRQILSSIGVGDEFRALFFIDDDKNLQGSFVGGVKVYSLHNAEKLFQKAKISDVVIAAPNLGVKRKVEILSRLEKHQITTCIAPSIDEILRRDEQIEEFRKVTIEDLLQREAIPPHSALLTPNIQDKIVLVTGGGGSIGSELCRQIVTLGAKKLIILDNSEVSLYTIHSELFKTLTLNRGTTKLVPILADVKSFDAMSNVVTSHCVDTVFHAAAYKHVPIVELNVIEAINNNVLGTKNMLDVVAESSVSNFVLISTDKAVRPTNYMGATKRVAELLCQAYAKSSQSATISMVRFGNVLGSSGSVIPRFTEQIKSGGPISVTHPEITRFFMTIPEAAELVIQASSMANGGELYLLEMGSSINILDLALRMVRLHGMTPYLEGEEQPGTNRSIEIKFTGLRTGEKLYEELLVSGDFQDTEHPLIKVADEFSVEIEELTSALIELEKACKAHNKVWLTRVLLELPLEFSPEANISDDDIKLM